MMGRRPRWLEGRRGLPRFLGTQWVGDQRWLPASLLLWPMVGSRSFHGLGFLEIFQEIHIVASVHQPSSVTPLTKARVYHRERSW